jgi:hypothetical protein
MHLRTPVLILACVVACVAACVGGCGGGGGRSPVEPVPIAQDSVSLLSITPTAGSRLAPGSVVTFSATASYELQSENAGAILLVLQDQDGHLLTIGPQARAEVLRGRGTATVADHVTVPAASVSQVRIYLALVPPDISAAQFLNQSPVQPSAIYPVGS